MPVTPPPPRSELDRRMDEFDLARRALKWMLEHKVYWDWRVQQLQVPGSQHGRAPFIDLPEDLHVYIVSLAREVDLEAESAG